MASTQPAQRDPHAQQRAEQRMLLMGVIMFLLTLGSMMVLFSATYIHDVNTLRNIPDALWNFVCGRPVETGYTLPLLLTLAIVAFATSGVLAFVRSRIRD